MKIAGYIVFPPEEGRERENGFAYCFKILFFLQFVQSSAPT